ncbi:hypothetical protein C8R42DRAFT_234807 [Lentinula raphanica]|nr:hypothetical protein C8R42DRAFT_234807 [Lentinula raphanica]
MAPSFSKPETVLKQAESLLSVNQPHAALQILSEMFTSKRFRSTPVTSLEPIMIRFMELCVELRKGRAAKEGLMQFKNLAQNTNVGSVEVVVGSFVGMAEGKVREVREEMRRAAAKEKEEKEKEGEVVDDVEDLEAPSTPESILLSSVSSSSTSTPTERTSRTLLTPALKFLWETYRTSLETLKNNARLELIYQSVAKKAFRFCLENGRKTEFRRLCEMLRMHLVNVGKWQQIQNQNALAGGGGGKDGGGGGGVRDSGNQINLGDAETLERHLETRFGQLNVSVELELWQEAFRSIEDIHNLLTIAASSTPTSSSSSTLTSTTPGAQNAATTTTTTTAGSTSLTIKSTMIANYYEKLSQVFLMSGNALYHAAAWAKYYELLTVGSEHTLKHDQRSILAGKVVVSALAVPITAGGANEVHPRLSALLNLPEPSSHSSSSISTSSTAPTRTSLLASLLSSDILPLAPKTVQDLYRALQVEFDPLGLAENVRPLLRELAGEDEHEAEEDEDEEKDGKGQGRWTNKEIYGRYIPLLHDAVLDRLLRGLGEVYSEVRIEDVVRMVSPLERGFGGVGGETGKKTLESYIDSYIVSLAKKGEMGIRIDHREHAILFIDEGLALGSDEAHAASSSSSASTTTSNPPYLPSSFPAFSSIDSNASGSVQPSPTSLVRTRLSAVAGCLDVASRALGVVQRARLQDASTSSEAHAQSEEFPSVETLLAYRKSLLLHQSLTFRRRQLNQELQARAQAQSMSVAAENARRAKEQARLLSLVEAREREAARRKAELEQIRRNEAEKYAKGRFSFPISYILFSYFLSYFLLSYTLVLPLSPSFFLCSSPLRSAPSPSLSYTISLFSLFLLISHLSPHLFFPTLLSSLLFFCLGLLEGGMGGILKGMGKEGREAVEKLTSPSSTLDHSSLLKMQLLALERDKSLRLSRLKTISKRLDHLTRAFRISELPLLSLDYSTQLEQERAQYERRAEEARKEAKERWEEGRREKNRLSRGLDGGFRKDWEERREVLVRRKGEEFALRREKAMRRIESEKAKRLEEFMTRKREREEKEAKEKELRERLERERAEQARLAREQAEEEERAAREEAEAAEREQRQREQKEKEDKDKAEVERKEKERMERLEQTQTQRKETGTAAAAPLAGGAWRRSTTTTTTTTSSSNTPLSSLPGTPTRQRTEGPTRSESPAPASQGKYVPGALGASRGGWRAREEAKANAAASGVSVSREGGGGTNSNVPSRTASPAPAPPRGDDDDGFTVVGGDKKGSSTGGAGGGSGVWKARRGSGMGGRSGR